MEKKFFLTTKEVCEIFRCSKQTIFRWVNENKLFPLDRDAKKWLFKVSDIEKIIGRKLDE